MPHYLKFIRSVVDIAKEAERVWDCSCILKTLLAKNLFIAGFLVAKKWFLSHLPREGHKLKRALHNLCLTRFPASGFISGLLELPMNCFED